MGEGVADHAEDGLEGPCGAGHRQEGALGGGPHLPGGGGARTALLTPWLGGGGSVVKQGREESQFRLPYFSQTKIHPPPDKKNLEGLLMYEKSPLRFLKTRSRDKAGKLHIYGGRTVLVAASSRPPAPPLGGGGGGWMCPGRQKNT